MAEIEFDPTTMRDVSIPLSALMRPALGLSFALFIVSIAPYVLIWGLPSSWDFGAGEVLLVIGGLLLLVVAHEAFHAVGWIVFGGVPISEMRFGIDRKTLSPYAHARTPMMARGYRIGAALPGIVTGILPTVIGTLMGNGWLAFLGAFMVAGAVGDLLVLWAIRNVPSEARVVDHPKNAGCYVME
jgi:Putative zincin peptidase